MVLALVLWGGHRTVMQAVEGLEKEGWTFDRLEPWWLVLAGAIYLVSQLPSGLFWRRTLLEMGQSVSLPRALRAYYIGHLGKYVPGKAMVLVLRTGLIKTAHIKTSVAIAAVFYETLTTMAIGSLVAAIMLFIGHREQWPIALVALGLAAAMGLPTAPVVFNTLLRVLRKDETAAQSIAGPIDADVEDDVKSSHDMPRPTHLRLSRIAPGWIGILIGWILMGLSLWGVIRGMGITEPAPWDGLTLYTAAVALAVVAGFVSMLPGGIGVREVALWELMEPAVGPTAAVGSALLLRLVTLAAEVVLAAVIYPLGKRLAWRKTTLT
jgi:uncharacterized membrane protein YbhN (UPF0104 family)